MKRVLSFLLLGGLLLSLAGCVEVRPGEGTVKEGIIPLPAAETPPAERSPETDPLPTADSGPPDAPPDPAPGHSSPPPGHSSPPPDHSSPPPDHSPPPPDRDPEPSSPPPRGDEVRAVWISYLELSPWLTGKSESAFRASVGNAFQTVRDFGLNTVICHVRPFGDALYRSSVFPVSYLVTGKEGDPLPFDPLAVMLDEAHSRGLVFEAWVNPYRIRTSNYPPLSPSNPAQAFLNAGSDAVYRHGNGLYYNPGSAEAEDLIVRGIGELVRNYDIDAVHFDDYFYAATDPSIDADLYAASGSSLPLSDWRRGNVSRLVKRVYETVHAAGRGVRFGIAPQGNLVADRDVLYADVAAWVSESGYVDYICPQIYWGFRHQTHDFDKILRQFRSLIRTDSVDLTVGLAAYKIGTPDAYAGAGKNEWCDNTDLLARMVASCRNTEGCGGFSIYSYNSIFSPAPSVAASVDAERSRLRQAL